MGDMARSRKTQLTQAIGEHLVCAELARRDVLSAPFAGNVPNFDLVATGARGTSVPVQVKAKKSGAWQLDASRYAEIAIEGDQQQVNGPRPSPIEGLVYVFVHLEQYGDDRFYVIDWTSLAQLVTTNHEVYLQHHGGVRPRNPKSVHTAVTEQHLDPYKDAWHRITDNLAGE